MKQRKSIGVYHSHKASADLRGIGFNISHEEWYNWWLLNGVDKDGPSQKEMGIPRKEVLCMCRHGDTGPYSLDNIYCATASQNGKDMTNRFSITRSVSTPEGIFNSITDWANFKKKRPSDFQYLRIKFPDQYKYNDVRENKPELI